MSLFNCRITFTKRSIIKAQSDLPENTAFQAGTALENVNIRFEKGKVCGIAGGNGAGKTTLFRCIAGLETYQGQIISEMTPLKNFLGFLPSEPYFFSVGLLRGRGRLVSEIYITG
jgi:ABC-type uncharacterized transport system fused permease/ATPase subunit